MHCTPLYCTLHGAFIVSVHQPRSPLHQKCNYVHIFFVWRHSTRSFSRNFQVVLQQQGAAPKCKNTLRMSSGRHWSLLVSAAYLFSVSFHFFSLLKTNNQSISRLMYKFLNLKNVCTVPRTKDLLWLFGVHWFKIPFSRNLWLRPKHKPQTLPQKV